MFMKTQLLRVSVVALAVSSLVLISGCEEKRVQSQIPLFTPAPTGTPVALATDPPPPMPVAESPAAPGAVAVSNRPAAQLPSPPPNPVVKVVQPPAPPADVQASPALAEVIKLVQAGVSDDVTLAYINSAPQPFGVNPDQMVYLNDLGVSGTIITSLIHHDALPEVAAHKMDPLPVLPAGLALTTPATNVYPATYAPDEMAAPGAGEPDLSDPAAYANAPLVPPQEPITPAYFQDALSPYGSWIEVDGYGLCWQPTVAVASPGWRPYCDRGRWLWTDCGWYWYSDYSWGWAPFHYGRWCSYPRVGWFWVPDTCWGPAWVSWRHSSSYCGWAPLPPSAVFVSGHGLYHRGHPVGLGFDFGLSASMYTFVEVGHLTDRSFRSHSLSGGRAVAVFNNTTVVNEYTVEHSGHVFNHGIGVEPVARAAGRPIPPVSVQHSGQLALAGRLNRHEQLQNNGSSLVVMKPLLNSSTHTAQPPSGLGRPGHSLNAAGPNRAAAAPSPIAPNVLLTPKAAENGIPPVRSGRISPNPTRPSAVARQPLPSAAPLPAKQEPAPGLRTPSASRPVTASRPADLGNPAVAAPPVRRPVLAQPAQPNRAVTPSPGRAVISDTYRVYAEPGVVAKPVTPRYNGSAPSYAAPAAPQPVRPQYVPPASVAPAPSYRSEPSRAPVVRSEPAHSPPATHSAPSPAPSRSGGGKKD